MDKRVVFVTGTHVSHRSTQKSPLSNLGAIARIKSNPMVTPEVNRHAGLMVWKCPELSPIRFGHCPPPKARLAEAWIEALSGPGLGQGNASSGPKVIFPSPTSTRLLSGIRFLLFGFPGSFILA